MPLFFFVADPSYSLTHPFTARLSPVVQAGGFELLHCETELRRHLLRLYIDGPNGVGCDDCQAVSRLVSDWLDAVGCDTLATEAGSAWLRRSYTLEVASPGLDRPLVTPRHFADVCGRQVAIVGRVAFADDGRRRVTGRLAASGDEQVEVESDGIRFAIAYRDMARARLVPKFAQGD